MVEELIKSPRLPAYVEELQRVLAEERERRERFYQEMTSEEKIEFINGEVVLHGPSRNAELDVTARMVAGQLPAAWAARNANAWEIRSLRFVPCSSP